MRIVAILIAALFALPATALGSDRFTDPKGDAQGSGPDITAVTLSHTDTALTIAVEFANAPPLAFDEDERYTDMLLIGIHTDDDLGRADVEFYTGAHGVDLTRAPVVRAGIESPRAQVGTAALAVDGATLSLTVERSLLDDPEEIAVSVAAGREYVDEGAAGGGGDEAPATGAFRYSLADGDTSGWVWPALVAGVAAAVLTALAVIGNRRRRPPGPVPLPS
jgi:hypothetical protein